MDVFFYKIIANILAGLLKVVDYIEQLFNVFAGIEDVKVSTGENTGVSTSLLDYFLQNETVANVFWVFIIVGVGILGAFTAYAVIRNLVVMKKTNGKIIGQFFSGLFAFFLVASVTITGIAASNLALGAVNSAFQVDGESYTLSQRIFAIGAEAVESGTAWRPGVSIKDVNLGVQSGDDIIGEYEKVLGPFEDIDEYKGTTSSGELVDVVIKSEYLDEWIETEPLLKDEIEQIKDVIDFQLPDKSDWVSLYKLVKDMFPDSSSITNGLKMAVSTIRYAQKGLFDSGDIGEIDYSIESLNDFEQDQHIEIGRIVGGTELEILFTDNFNGYILEFGSGKNAVYIFDCQVISKSQSTYDKYDNTASWGVTPILKDLAGKGVQKIQMYKIGLIDPLTYNWALAYIAAIVLIIVLFVSALSLAKRVFDIIFLFFSMPFPIATMPSDDGARFKLWKDTMISKVILAYGTVIAVNLFLLVLPLITSITFSVNKVVNCVAQLIFIIAGAVSIYGAQLLFARLFGTSAEESREMMNAFRGAGSFGRMLFGAAMMRRARGGSNGEKGFLGKTASKIGSGIKAVGRGGRYVAAMGAGRISSAMANSKNKGIRNLHAFGTNALDRARLAKFRTQDKVESFKNKFKEFNENAKNYGEERKKNVSARTKRLSDIEAAFASDKIVRRDTLTSQIRKDREKREDK